MRMQYLIFFAIYSFKSSTSNMEEFFFVFLSAARIFLRNESVPEGLVPFVGGF